MPGLRTFEIGPADSPEIPSVDNFFWKMSMSGVTSFLALSSDDFPCLGLIRDWEILVEAEASPKTVVLSLNTKAEFAMQR